MKLYTSYWAQVRNFPKNLIILNTTVWPPKWYGPLGYKDKNGVISIDCPPLKPGQSCAGLCNGKCNPKHPEDCAFLKEYRKQLDNINIDAFIAKLFDLSYKIEKQEHLYTVNFAFVVFEKYDNPCSERWVIQQWLKDNNIEVTEWHR